MTGKPKSGNGLLALRTEGSYVPVNAVASRIQEEQQHILHDRLQIEHKPADSFWISEYFFKSQFPAL